MLLANDRMLITTTSTIEGKEIVEYKGLVCGEVITGINVIKDFFAGLCDFFGGRSGGYENELISAREAAIKEMKKRAVDMKANAIIGVDIDYEVMGTRNGMLMVSVTGTAVVIR